MDKTITISILIITRNRASFIGQAINSVLAQDYKHWELIIVDDRSTDDTEKIVDQYKSKVRAITYIKNSEPKTIGGLRNLSASFAKGKYLAILDSDDVWPDQAKLSKQYAFLENHPDYGVIGSQAITIDEHSDKIGQLTFPLTDDQIRQTILSRNPLCHSSTLIRKTAFDQVKGYNNTLRVWEDYELFLKIGVQWKLANSADVATSYRVHTSGISKSKPIAGALLHLKIITRYRKIYPGFINAFVRGLLRIGLRMLGK